MAFLLRGYLNGRAPLASHLIDRRTLVFKAVPNRALASLSVLVMDAMRRVYAACASDERSKRRCTFSSLLGVATICADVIDETTARPVDGRVAASPGPLDLPTGARSRLST